MGSGDGMEVGVEWGGAEVIPREGISNSRVVIFCCTPPEELIQHLMRSGHAVTVSTLAEQIAGYLRSDLSVYDLVVCEWSRCLMPPENVSLLDLARKEAFAVPIFFIFLEDDRPEEGHASDAGGETSVRHSVLDGVSSSLHAVDGHAEPDQKEEEEKEESRASRPPQRRASSTSPPPLPTPLDRTFVLRGRSFRHIFDANVALLSRQIRVCRLLRNMRGDITLMHEITKKIASGLSSDVYKALFFASQGKVALKVLPICRSAPDQMERVYKEVAIMRGLDHTNVVAFSNVNCTQTQVSIFMELCDFCLAQWCAVLRHDPSVSGLWHSHPPPPPSFSPLRQGVGEGSLPSSSSSAAPSPSRAGASHRPMASSQEGMGSAKKGAEERPGSASLSHPHAFPSRPTVCSIIHDVLQGVEYVHASRITHGDIQPKHILFLNGVAKLGDFSCAVIQQGFGPPRCEREAAFPYASPEVFLGEEYGFSCDIWSFGVVLAEMLGLHFAHTALLNSADVKAFYQSLLPEDTLPLVVMSCPYQSVAKPSLNLSFRETVHRTLQAAYRCGRAEQRRRRNKKQKKMTQRPRSASLSPSPSPDPPRRWFVLPTREEETEGEGEDKKKKKKKKTTTTECAEEQRYATPQSHHAADTHQMTPSALRDDLSEAAHVGIVRFGVSAPSPTHGTSPSLPLSVSKRRSRSARPSIVSSSLSSAASFGAPSEKQRTMYVLDVDLQRMTCAASTHSLPATLVELLESCFYRDPAQRITVEQLLAHPLLKNKEWLRYIFLEVRSMLASVKEKKKKKIPLKDAGEHKPNREEEEEEEGKLSLSDHWGHNSSMIL